MDSRAHNFFVLKCSQWSLKLEVSQVKIYHFHQVALLKFIYFAYYHPHLSSVFTVHVLARTGMYWHVLNFWLNFNIKSEVFKLQDCMCSARLGSKNFQLGWTIAGSKLCSARRKFWALGCGLARWILCLTQLGSSSRISGSIHPYIERIGQWYCLMSFQKYFQILYFKYYKNAYNISQRLEGSVK